MFDLEWQEVNDWHRRDDHSRSLLCDTPSFFAPYSRFKEEAVNVNAIFRCFDKQFLINRALLVMFLFFISILCIAASSSFHSFLFLFCQSSSSLLFQVQEIELEFEEINRFQMLPCVCL